ncbi:MAG TPA: hypothetical protein VJR70_09130 [Stellaceae bacterium]|nr:hypothetical protein [Stellaceae bacterium]
MVDLQGRPAVEQRSLVQFDLSVSVRDQRAPHLAGVDNAEQLISAAETVCCARLAFRQIGPARRRKQGPLEDRGEARNRRQGLDARG